MSDPVTPDPVTPDPLDLQDTPDAGDLLDAEDLLDADDEPTDDEPAPDALKPMRGESVAAAVGSFMAGIEQQVFQRRPPAVELVQEMQHARGTTGDGLEITLHIPDLPPAPDRPER